MSHSDDLTERIQHYIQEQNMRAGMRLPSERVLSEKLSAGRGSIREALRELSAMGVIEKQPRSGTYIRSTTGEVVPKLTQRWMRVDSEHVEHIFEMRLLIEPGCAALAATRAAQDDLDALRQAMQAMHDSIRDSQIAAFQQADADFHQAITYATRNPHLVHLIEGVTTVLEQSVRISLSVPGQMERALAGHQQILTAIENQQPAWAEAAMQTHLRDAWHYIVMLLTADDPANPPASGGD